jgi:hypothetical protein
VHLRVNDAATGQPTPVRLRCTGPDGTYYAPFGRLSQGPWHWSADCAGSVEINGNMFAYIDGTCEIRLPVGPVRVEAHKGPEYTPLDEEIRLGPGKLALRLTIQRWTNERQSGWFSGDFGAHELTPHAALLEAAAEDLAVVDLLAREEGRDGQVRFPNLLAFSGQRPALEIPGHLVVVNTLNTHPRLGQLALLNTHRVVYPLRFGDGPEGQEDWTMADWCDQCHRKGGLVVWEHSGGFSLDGESFCEEALADLLLGRIDTIRVPFFYLADWYALLGCGFHVPLCAGVPRWTRMPLGAARNYARLRPGEEFSYRSWIEAIRAGRTYATEGPLLTFSVNDLEPGDVVATTKGAKVRIAATARNLAPADRLELVVNGEVVAGCGGSGSPCTAHLDEEIPFSRSGWVAARCWHGAPDPEIERATAHTAPISVRVDGQPTIAPSATVRQLLAQIDHTITWVEREARCDTDAQRQRLAAVFQQARQVLAQLPTA